MHTSPGLSNRALAKKNLLIKRLSRDMNEHDQYMADLMRVFATLDRWAPGTAEETLRALNALPAPPQHLLEIGCGKGLSTLLLAQKTQSTITALDNDEPALASLQTAVNKADLAARVKTVCASMTEMPFESNRFDTIWAEGCAYVMGVTNALSQWRPLLKKEGVLMLSDLVWLTDTPSKSAADFWSREYPDMSSIEKRLQQAEAAGYRVLTHFTLHEDAWRAYYEPLKVRVTELENELGDSTAMKDIKTELGIYEQHLGEFGYEVFVMQKVDN